MADKKSLSRRKFLQTSGLAAAGLSTVSAKSYDRILGANDRILTTLIGCGSIANSHRNSLLELREQDNVEIASVCDVYRSRAEEFQSLISEATGQQPRLTTSYEEALEMDDLTYATVCTPEHWHAPIALDALDRGLHVYCEKPLTHTLEESKVVVDKVRKTGLKFQVGVQGMSDDSYESANRAIREGKLGTIIEAQIEYVRNNSQDQGPWRTGVVSDMPKPDDLDWKTWLGPATDRPWDPHRYFEWRNYFDYSGGIATDLFIHRLTRILKACDLKFPSRVVGMGGIYLWDDGRELPDNLEMLAEYPAIEGITNGMTVHILGTMGNDRGIDHLIRGDEATLEFTSSGWEITSLDTDEVIETHEKTGGEDMTLHHHNIHEAIREDVETKCPAELGMYGVAATEGVVRSAHENRMCNWDPMNRNWA
jgi:predicted dehydrogenase